MIEIEEMEPREHINGATIGCLVQQLASEDIDQAARAARALGTAGTEQAVPALIDALKASLCRYHKRSLSVAVIEALGKLRAKAAEEILLRALQSSLYPVKSAAVAALGRLEPSDHSVERIKGIIDQDTPKAIKKDAIRGLGHSGRPKAAKKLVEVVRSETDPDLKREAVEALGEANEPVAALPLEEHYRREADRRLRTEIIEALSKIGTTGSIGLLLNALKDRDPEIRASAALGLGTFGLPHTALALKALLSDPVEQVRRSAAMALGLIEHLPRREG
jgi:HEAT repeat protein